MEGDLDYIHPNDTVKHVAVRHTSSSGRLIPPGYTCSHRALPKEGALSQWINYVGLKPLT